MKRAALFILTVSLIGVTGCVDLAYNKPQEVNAMERETELTLEKKDFLATMSMDEERIQAGELYDWQEEVLRQYDYAMEYLEKKYPSHKFKFTSCNPKGRDESFSTFWFIADNGEKSYELYVDVDNGGKYSCEDNYYGELIKDSYNTVLLSILQENIQECIGVSSKFNTVQGEEFGETLTGQKILDDNEKISNTTYIYAVPENISNAEDLADEIESFIEEKKIYGSYYVDILSMNPGSSYKGDKLEEYVQTTKEIVVLEQKFNQFN